MTNGTSVTDYPIIGFTNYGGAPRYRIWDENTANGWVNINLPVNYNAAFEAVNMEAYNFGDPSLTGANPVNYTADWSNPPTHAPSPPPCCSWARACSAWP